MNRAVGKRPMFESEADIRGFIACAVASVRRGEIRIQAFTFMTTHFHMIVESVVGALAEAFRRIESDYVTGFNRRHDRDGPLVRGRFLSKLVAHDAYWANLVQYLDDNAVAAGIVADPAAYPHASAFHYVRDEGPHWLNRDPVERFVVARSGGRTYDPADYRRLFHRPIAESHREWIQSRIERGDRHDDAFADLVRASSEYIKAWLVERARVADGTTPGVPIVDFASLQTAISGCRSTRPVWRIGRTKRCDVWTVLTAGLLRSVVADSFETIARRMNVPLSTARDRSRRHAILLRSDPDYREAAEAVTTRALQSMVEVWA